MSEKDFKILLIAALEKVDKSLYLVEASLKKLVPYDGNTSYTPDELEPYDALCDRFIRCVEVFIKFYKTYDRYSSITSAPTYRDLMSIMEKLQLVTSLEVWMNMRDVRNRIVHDYLPQQTQEMFASIMNEFYAELKYSQQKIADLRF